MSTCQSCGVGNEPRVSACRACGAVLPPADPGAARCRAHPDAPATGTCERCGSFGCGACLAPRGVAMRCADCLAREAVLPWDDRASIGLWRAWWRTSVRLMLSPQETLGSARPDGAMGGSLGFAFLSTVVGFLPTLSLGFLGLALGLGLVAAPALEGLEPGFVVAGMGGYGVLIVVVQLTSVLVFSLLDHVMLTILGARPGSLSVTVRANALALAPMLVGLVPGCGLYVFPIWSLVLRVMAVKQLHRAAAWQAILAVIVPLVVLCGLAAVGYLGLLALFMGEALR